MPRGYPDDNIQSSPLGQTIADNAELAARLGSITTVQRSGQVVYATKFTDGASDWYIYPQSDAYGKVRGNLGIIAPTSLELYPGVLDTGYILAFKLFPMLDISRAGVEYYVNFKRTAAAPDQDLQVFVAVTLEGVEYVFIMHWLPKTNQFDIYEYTGGTVLVHHVYTLPYDLYDSLDYPTFHYVKLVVDPENRRFLRLYVDYLAYDLSMYECAYHIPIDSPSIIVRFYMGHIVDATVVNIGSVVLTINEP